MRKETLYLLFIIFLTSCSTKDKKPAVVKEEPQIGKYLYLDKEKVIHSKSGCGSVYKDHNMQQVNPIDPVCLSFDNLSRVCSKCVTEQMIDSLNTLFEIYRQTYINVGDLYEDLESRYDDIPEELQFRKQMRDKVMVERLYKILIEKGAQPGTLDEFTEYVGLTKPAKTNTQKNYASYRRRKLYNILVKDGFDLGSFSDFNANIDNDKIRYNIWKAAVDAGWDLPDYKQFEKDMAIHLMKIGGKIQEVDDSTWENFIKRHPNSRNR